MSKHQKVHISRTKPLVLQALKAQDAALSDSEEKDEADAIDGRGERTALCTEILIVHESEIS